MEPSHQPGPQSPPEAPVLPDEMVHRIFDLADGSDVARAAVNQQWSQVGSTRHFLSALTIPITDDPQIWKQKYDEEYGSKPRAMPSSPPLPPTAEDASQDWKSKYATEKKIETATSKIESQGMYFVPSGDNSAKLQFFNPQTNNQFQNYQIVYTAPQQATFRRTPSSSPGTIGPYDHIAGLKFEGEHDNIARPDWKNFKPPPPDEEPALMYAYSPDASDVAAREKTRRK